MTYGQKYFCWKYNKVLKCPTIICTLFKNPKGGEIATPLEFLDIPMGQKYPSTLNPKAASLMINKTKAHPHCHMDFVAFLFYFIITSSLTPHHSSIIFVTLAHCISFQFAFSLLSSLCI